MLLAESLAFGDALGCFLEQQRCGGRRAAPLRELADRDGMNERTKPDPELIASFHLLRWLRPRAIELDLATVDRFGGKRTCFEEAGGPEPLVDAYCVLMACVVVRHGVKLTDCGLGDYSHGCIRLEELTYY